MPKKPYSLLDDKDFSSGVRESMLNIAAKRKSISTVSRLSDVSIEFLDFMSIYLSCIVGSRGPAHASVLEIIGKDSVGKSSLVFTVGGIGMSQGSPFFYAETESKVMHPERIMRCLDTNPEMAKKKLDLITMDEPDDLPSAKSEIEAFVESARTRGVPMDVPVIVALDSFSKLMSPVQAKGRSAYGEDDSSGRTEFAEAKVDFGHAKLAHEWCRELPAWLRRNNVIFLVVSHQNDKVQTQQGGGSFIDPEMVAGYNRTKRGGNATNQTSALQLVLTPKKMLKKGTEKVGDTTNVTVVKNSYGPKYGIAEFDVISRPWLDTETYQQPAISWDRPTADWLAANKYFGVTANRKKYSCEALGLRNEDPHAFYQEFKNSELVPELASIHSVLGFEVPDTAEQQSKGVDE